MHFPYNILFNPNEKYFGGRFYYYQFQPTLSDSKTWANSTVLGLQDI